MYTFPIIHTLACLPIRSKHSYSYTSLPHHLTLDFAWLRLRFTPTLLPRMQAACVHACSPPNKVGNTTAPTPLPTLSTSFRSFPPIHIPHLPFILPNRSDLENTAHPLDSQRQNSYKPQKRNEGSFLHCPALQSDPRSRSCSRLRPCIALPYAALHCTALRYATLRRLALPQAAIGHGTKLSYRITLRFARLAGVIAKARRQGQGQMHSRAR